LIENASPIKVGPNPYKNMTRTFDKRSRPSIKTEKQLHEVKALSRKDFYLQLNKRRAEELEKKY
jgi:hypothetical protein